MIRLLLLDRDGTLIRESEGFVTETSQLELLAGAGEAVAKANRAGVKVALVTNQSVVGRGLIDAARLEAIHAHLQTLLAAHGARLDAIYAATDHPDHPSPRRKPGTGMLEEALRDFGASASETVMIGDDLRDLQAAAALSMPRVLVRTGKGARCEARPECAGLSPAIHDDLAAAVDALLAPQ